MDELKVQIKNDRIYAPLKRQWLKRTPEEEVRQDFICHLVNNYGYSLEQMEQEVTTTESSERGTGKARADIVIWANSNDKYKRKRALIVVECKAACVSITPKAYYQGFNYASWMHTKFLILTNQKETKYFKLNEEIVPQTFIDLEEIDDIPNAQQAKKYSGKVFSFSVPDGLLPRNKEADKLFEGVINNRFFNLIGVGGSGKSSLTYLMMQKHEDDFNEIAYVVVNNISIKEDIISQLNQFLKLEFGKDDNPYQNIVTYLEDNFKSSKPNLLVLDINELSNDVKDFAQNIHKLCPKNWKILFLSREDIDTSKIMEKEDLYHNQDAAFLKTLFLIRAGERYTDFADFNELFETIFYNPLLAEQLGFYLTRLPETKTLEQIKGILYCDKFKNKDMKGFATQTNDNRSTIIDFLTNLISYDSDTFDHNEKELLRHFILWQTDFINYNVIKQLLKGVFESDDDLDETLGKLSDRAILMIQTADCGSLAYKLHGLLAESLRGQIDMSIDKYPTYEQNAKRIDIHDNVPVDVNVCIYTSYCIWGEKMQDITKGQYLQVWSHHKLALLLNNPKSMQYHFNKSIEIGEKLPTNNPEYQEALAMSFLGRAYYISTRFQNYELAKKDYDEAINILEQLPHDNPEYQNDLALAYNDCALLQVTYLGDIQLAAELYKKTIEISKETTKNTKDPYLWNTLALAHNNLGMIQLQYLDETTFAEHNFAEAIKLGEMNTKDTKDPLITHTLVLAYGNLGMLQQSHFGDIKSAVNNYRKAIEKGIIICENTEDPQFFNSLARSYNNLGMLQQFCLNDIQSAETNYKKAIEIGESIPKDIKDPQILNTFALAHNNLGTLQLNCRDNYQSAETNFKTAIDISKKNTKISKDPQILYTLGLAYNNAALIEQDVKLDYKLAMDYYTQAITIFEHITQHSKSTHIKASLASAYQSLAYIFENDFCKNYKTAKEYYNKAINIMELLPKDNQKYQSDLSSIYHDLGLLQEVFFNDYQSAKIYYTKEIEIIEQLRLLNNNTEFQVNLSQAYFCLALVQIDLQDYESAKMSFCNAIGIREQLPTSNHEYQNYLALAYKELAKLLKNEYFNDYESAKNYFNKAITIWEHLPKDNIEYQNNLANTYNKLAYIFKDGFKDYEVAKDICNKAIEIGEQLSITNPNDYLNNWINYKHSLAEIYFDNDEIETAKSILVEIKPQAEKHLAENPNDEWTQTVNNDINVLLKKIYQLQ